MDDNKLKTLQPKIKLRELKAIQKGELNFKKTLGRQQERKPDANNDRELKKIQLYEKIFEKREKEVKRRQELRKKRELKRKHALDIQEELKDDHGQAREPPSMEEIQNIKSFEEDKNEEVKEGEVGGKQKSINRVIQLIEQYMGPKLEEGETLKKRRRGRRRKSSIMAEKERIRQREEELNRALDQLEVVEVNDKQMSEEKKKIQELENKLRMEEDEMREILKEKSWYQKYVSKIIDERQKSEEMMDQIMKEAEQSDEKDDFQSQSLLEMTIRAQKNLYQQQEAKQQSQKVRYYDLLRHNLKIIQDQGDDNKVTYCMVQTKDQIKQHLEKVNMQLDKTKEALTEIKNLQNIKSELTQIYGIKFEELI